MIPQNNSKLMTPPIIQHRLYHSLCLLTLGLTVLIVFAKPLLTGTVPLHTDGYFMTYPALAYFKRWAAQGHFPVWWIADSITGNWADAGGIGPAWLIFTPAILLLDLKSTWLLTFILMFSLSGFCMYFYLLKVTSRQYLASLFGALCFLRSEWIVDCLVDPQIQLFLFPSILLTYEKLIETAGLRYILLAGFLMAGLFLGSNVHYPLYLLPLTWLYFLLRLNAIPSARKKIKIKIGWYGLLGMIWFFALAWFRPKMLAVAGLASTRETLKQLFPIILSPLSFFTILFPDFLTSPLIQFPFMADRLMHAVFHGLFSKEIRVFEMAYPGLFAIFFLCLGWSLRKKITWDRPHWISFGIFFIYVAGGELLIYKILSQIPVLNMVKNTIRISVIATVTIPMLAAAGLQILIAAGRDSQMMKAVQKWVWIFGAFFASIFIFSVSKGILLGIIDRFYRDERTSFYLSFILSHSHYGQPEAFYLQRLNELVLWLKTWISWKDPRLFLTPFFYGLAFLIYLSWKRKKLAPLLASTFFIALVMTDNFILHPLPFHTLRKLEEAYPVDSAIKFLKSDSSPFRILSLKPKNELPFPWGHSQFLPGDTPLVYGISSVQGYQAITPRRYSDIFKLLAKVETLDSIRLTDVYEYDDSFADLLNVKYFITKKPQTLTGKQLVFENNAVSIYLNEGFMPRAFLVKESRVVKNFSESLEGMKSKAWDFRQSVFLEGAGAPEIHSKDLSLEDRAEILYYSPHIIRMKVTAADLRVLVFTESYHPSWKCRLNGKQVPIFIADHAFRGILVPEGDHEIEFWIEPFSTPIYFGGLIFSCLLTLGLYETYRRKEKTPVR